MAFSESLNVVAVWQREGGTGTTTPDAPCMHAQNLPFPRSFLPFLNRCQISLSPSTRLNSRIWRGEFPMEWRCGRSNFALPVSSLTQSNQIDCRPFGCHVRQSTATTTSAVSSQSSFNDRSSSFVTESQWRHQGICVCVMQECLYQ